MAKAKVKQQHKVFTLFQHKNFTIVFFLAVFALIGGVFYLLQSSAAGVSLTGCTVKSSGYGNGVKINIYVSGSLRTSRPANTSFRIPGLKGQSVSYTAGVPNRLIAGRGSLGKLTTNCS